VDISHRFWRIYGQCEGASGLSRHLIDSADKSGMINNVAVVIDAPWLNQVVIVGG